MPNRPTALTAAAGEHFLAYRLAAMGYPVALTRGGSPSIDLMVGDLDGRSAVSIQVKTSNWAWRSYKRKTERNHWEWDVGARALKLRGDSILYAFVDLKWSDERPPLPDVFVVPSAIVADFLGPGSRRQMFWIMEAEEPKYFDRWDLITEKLDG